MQLRSIDCSGNWRFDVGTSYPRSTCSSCQNTRERVVPRGTPQFLAGTKYKDLSGSPIAGAGADANTTVGAGDCAGGCIMYLFVHLVLKIIHETIVCVVVLCGSMQCLQDKGVVWNFGPV